MTALGRATVTDLPAPANRMGGSAFAQARADWERQVAKVDRVLDAYGQAERRLFQLAPLPPAEIRTEDDESRRAEIGQLLGVERLEAKLKSACAKRDSRFAILLHTPAADAAEARAKVDLFVGELVEPFGDVEAADLCLLKAVFQDLLRLAEGASPRIH